MAKTTEPIAIDIPRIELQRLEIRLTGVSPLIVHAWSEKAKKEMLDKQMKKAKTAKVAKDPWADFCDSMYWLSSKPAKPTQQDVNAARFGFPCVAFKGAAVTASGDTEGMKMTHSRRRFHVVGELATIESGPPSMREDLVRVGMGTADLRYRGEFKEWAVALLIEFNSSAISAEQIVNLFNLGGFGVGVGEWRPERDGSFGRFRVA